MSMDQFCISNKILKEFFNVDKIQEVKPYGGGHINNTFAVIFPTCSYILQRINTSVFVNPFAVTNNIKLITDYIRKNAIYEGEDPKACVLTPIMTRYDQPLAIVDDECWRCMRFIEEGTTYDEAPSTDIFYEAGRGIGEFQKQLNGFDPILLVDTIKHFHDTPYRYKYFKDIVKLDHLDRKKECIEEIDYINDHSKKMDIITNLLDHHKIPKRVTHNDTKLNNIMISKTTGKVLGMLDLDTVMKGSLLYDYGDALRIGASTSAEDERDLSKVDINYAMFAAFSKGFLKEIKGIITDTEIKHLIDGFYLMTLEVGMRFLGDYINGDVYFRLNDEQKNSRPKINLERAKCQLTLAKKIEDNIPKLKEILNIILKELKYDVVLSEE